MNPTDHKPEDKEKRNARSWLDDIKPGYFHTCRTCGQSFIGNKARRICRLCAPLPEDKPPQSETPFPVPSTPLPWWHKHPLGGTSIYADSESNTPIATFTNEADCDYAIACANLWKTLEARATEAERRLTAVMPWVLFYRDGKSLADIAKECGGTIYNYSPWLFAPLLKASTQQAAPVDTSAQDAEDYQCDLRKAEQARDAALWDAKCCRASMSHIAFKVKQANDSPSIRGHRCDARNAIDAIFSLTRQYERDGSHVETLTKERDAALAEVERLSRLLADIEKRAESVASSLIATQDREDGHFAELAKLRGEIAGRWRPIAEAPRDGVILAFRKGARTNAVVLVFWSEKTESWMSTWNGARLTPQPTLWQPITLPQPPEGAA